MGNYTIEYLNHTLTSSVDTNGNITHQDKYTEQKVKIYRSRTQGMQKMKRIDYCEMQEEVITSTLDLKIWNLLVNSYKKHGICEHNGSPISINGLSSHFEVTRQKISKFIKRAKDANFIQVRNRLIYINPHVLVPYAISDNDLYDLQQQWETNSTS